MSRRCAGQESPFTPTSQVELYGDSLVKNNLTEPKTCGIAVTALHLLWGETPVCPRDQQGDVEGSSCYLFAGQAGAGSARRQHGGKVEMRPRIHQQRFARDVLGALGAEEDNGVGDVFRHACAAQGC